MSASYNPQLIMQLITKEKVWRKAQLSLGLLKLEDIADIWGGKDSLRKLLTEEGSIFSRTTAYRMLPASCCYEPQNISPSSLAAILAISDSAYGLARLYQQEEARSKVRLDWELARIIQNPIANPSSRLYHVNNARRPTA